MLVINTGVRQGRAAAAALAALGCVLIALLAVPALASAAEIPVNTTADEADFTLGTGLCETAAHKCSLRAAIETSDANPATAPSVNEITFDTINVFDGARPGSTITLLSELPEILHPVEIVGGECATVLGEGPCVEVDGTAAAPPSVFHVLADETTISGIAIEGGENGVEVSAGRTGFKAVGDWFGVELTAGGGSGGGSEEAGIYLNQGADDAVIGGTEPEERDVFVRSRAGVVVRGASGTTVQGNYLGVEPVEPTVFPLLEVGIQVGDDEATSSGAEHTEIGGELSPSQASSTPCDGPCNAIATTVTAIQLTGSTTEHLGAATGPTTIRGNYIGLGPDGTTAIGDPEVDIYGGPQDGGTSTVGPGAVKVGGLAPTERNYLVGGEYGLYFQGAEKLQVDANEIGYGPGHTLSEAPSDAGIHLESDGVTEGAVVFGNRINAEGANGVENEFAGAEIVANEIVGASNGVTVEESDEGIPNKITLNKVIEADGYGIRIANDSNLVLGNAVIAPGRVGIVTFEPAEHDRIGGDEPGEANLIQKTGETSGEGEGAIVVGGLESSLNEVAANEGSSNEGPFIDLQRENTGEGKPNHGIEPPIFVSALQSSSSGTAQSNATVRIFSKASSEEGELGALLKVVTVDSSGNWTATYATQPVGALVAATQTSTLGGTSEVSAPQVAAADPSGGGGGGSGGGGSSPPPVINAPPASTPPAKTAPATKITKKPKKSSKLTTATFRFIATPAAGAKFECKLDGKKFAACRSPKTYKKLKSGTHTFQVRAVAAGLKGPAAKFKFTVKS